MTQADPGDLAPQRRSTSGRLLAPRRSATARPRPTRPRLTAAQERALVERIARGGAGSLLARHELTERMQGLVRSIAVRYAPPGVEVDELVQEGNLGLLTAIDRFDPARGTRFSTYATPCIQQAIERRGGDLGRAIRLPAYLVEGLRKLRKLATQLAHALGREPADAELAAAAGREPTEVGVLLGLDRRPLSLDAPVGEEGGPLGELVGDARVATPIEAIARQELRQQLDALVGGLPERERLVIERRFALTGGEPATHQELGVHLGVSRERARQLEVAALGRLRVEARKCDLHALL